MDDELDISNEDILAVFGINKFDEYGVFFDAYLDVKNEIKALAKSGLTLSMLKKWKSTDEYLTHKKDIDEYLYSLLETEAIESGLDGSFKHQELLLSHNDEKYSKDKGKGDKEPINVDSMVTNLMKKELGDE
jgi:hypothetical protein